MDGRRNSVSADPLPSGAPTRLRILAVGMCPPPYIGQALMFQKTADWLAAQHTVDIIDTQFQRRATEAGQFSLTKLATFLRLLLTRIVFLPLKSRYDILYYTPSAASLFGVLKDLAYLSFLRLACRATAYHFHGTGGMAYVRDQNILIRTWAKFALFRPDLAIRCADVTPNDAELCEARNAVVVFNGIADPLPQTTLPPDLQAPPRLTLSFIGMITRQKGVFDLIEIVALLKARGHDAQLHLIGQGSDDELGELRRLISERGVTSAVTLHGSVSDAEKYRLLGETSVFVFPTFFHAETQPAAVIEALALGIPAVVSDWRGLKTIVDDGVNGYLVPPHEPARFVDAIEMVLSPNSHEDMRRAARRIFLERFTFDRYARELNAALVKTVQGLTMRP